MGVQEMTRFGMKEDDFDVLSGYIADVVAGDRNVKEEVIDYRHKFLEMKFCLPAAQAVPLAAKILTSVSPNPSFAELFIDNLEKNLQ